MHRRSWTSSFFVTLSASILALTASFPTSHFRPEARLLARAQSPGQTSPTFRTGANYVRVDVYATQNGNPVTDLRQDEFTVLEDGKRQEVDRFEFINIRDGGPAPVFLEPATVTAARQPTVDGRTRLFVLFLDRPHVDDKGSSTIREPLLNALRRTISDRDLVAVMTPDMTVTELTFSTKTTALERFIERDRFWGERSRLAGVDPFELELKRCFPSAPEVEELIARRREKRTMDAVQSLVEYLGNLREERKAILLFSSGWLRFEPTRKFDNLGGRPPIVPPAIGPLPGRGTAGDVAQTDAEVRAACLTERDVLANVNHEFAMSRMMALANRGNTSFYPIDPRGLAVFDDPDKVLSGGSAAAVEYDRRNLSKRLSALRELADGTDGLAVVNTNSLDAGLRRIVDDLSSYYLLSYASNGPLDGKFHSITVRSSRPGVSIRARRGFLASEPGVPSTTRNGVAPASPVAPDAVTLATRSAFDRLAASVRDVPSGAIVAAGWTSLGSAAVPSFTIVAEVRDRTKGATIDVIITSQDGTTAASGRGRIDPGSASVIFSVGGTETVRAGAYAAQIRIQDSNGTETLRVPVNLPSPPGGTGAVYYKRGQSTGNREVATADLRFRRSDRLRIELPATSDTPGDLRLLDRSGNPLGVPLEANVRTGNEGVRWTSVSLSLAPLAAGDYLVEIATAGQRLVVPFRVVP